MKKYTFYLIVLFIFLPFIVYAQIAKINAIEYFFDADPGVGQGSMITFTAADSINTEFTFDLSNVTAGLHQLYIRASNTNGRWGIPVGQMIFVLDKDPNANTPKITELEYFFNQDPGFGLAEKINMNADTLISLDDVFSLCGYHKGIDTLAFRFKNEYDSWGMPVVDTVLMTDDCENGFSFPSISLSKSRLNFGDSVEFHGRGFTPNTFCELTVSGPLSYNQTLIIKTDAVGNFSYYYKLADNYYLGDFNVIGKDTSKNENSNTQRFEYVKPETNYQMTFVQPTSETKLWLFQIVNLKWYDKINLYSNGKYKIEGTDREFNYKIEMTYDGIKWDLVGYHSGYARLFEENLFSYPFLVINSSNEVKFRITDELLSSQALKGGNGIQAYSRFCESDKCQSTQTTVPASWQIEKFWDEDNLKLWFNDLSQVKTNKPNPDGVIADGNSRIQFFLRIDNNSDPIEWVKVKLRSTESVIENLGYRYKGTVLKAKVWDKTNNQIQSYIFSDGLKVEDTWQAVKDIKNGEFYFWYVAPQEYYTDDQTIMAKRTLRIDMRFQFEVKFKSKSNSVLLDEQQLNIRRPSILLVHGWNSSPEAMTELEKRLKDNFFGINIYKPRLCPYCSYADNSTSIINDPDNGIKKVIRDNILKGYANTKIDWIGHSMGGSLARAVDDNSHDLDLTYQKGYINKLITINSPHLGSPFANIITDISECLNNHNTHNEIGTGMTETLKPLVVDELLKDLLNSINNKRWKTSWLSNFWQPGSIDPADIKCSGWATPDLRPSDAISDLQVQQKRPFTKRFSYNYDFTAGDCLFNKTGKKFESNSIKSYIFACDIIDGQQEGLSGKGAQAMFDGVVKVLNYIDVTYNIMSFLTGFQIGKEPYSLIPGLSQLNAVNSSWSNGYKYFDLFDDLLKRYGQIHTDETFNSFLLNSDGIVNKRSQFSNTYKTGEEPPNYNYPLYYFRGWQFNHLQVNKQEDIINSIIHSLNGSVFANILPANTDELIEPKKVIFPNRFIEKKKDQIQGNNQPPLLSLTVNNSSDSINLNESLKIQLKLNDTSGYFFLKININKHEYINQQAVFELSYKFPPELNIIGENDVYASYFYKRDGIDYVVDTSITYYCFTKDLPFLLNVEPKTINLKLGEFFKPAINLYFTDKILDLSSQFNNLKFNSNGIELLTIDDKSQVLIANKQGKCIYYIEYNGLKDSIFVNIDKSINIPSNKPELLFPLNNSTITVDSLLMKWHSVTNANIYDIYISLDSSFTNTICYQYDLIDTSNNNVNLALYHKYFWRVKAKANGFYSPWSDTWSFYLKQRSPRIINSTRNQIICKNTDAILYVKLLGDSIANQKIFQFQWQKNGKNIIGATKDSLKLQNCDYSMSDIYRCVITNYPGLDTVSTDDILIYVTPPVSITQNPISQKVQLDGVARFEVGTMIPNIKNSGQPLFKWFKKNKLLFDDNRISGTNSNMISIANVKDTDYDSTYSVSVFDPCAKNEEPAYVDSKLFALIRPDTVIEKDTAKITIKTNPKGDTKCVGDNALFITDLNDNTKNKTVTYQWYKGNTKLVANSVYIGSTSKTLTLNGISVNEQDDYQLIVTVMPDNYSISSAVAKLTVNSKPSIITQTTGIIELNLGDPLSLLIKAGVNTLPLSYKWYLNGVEILNATNDYYTKTKITAQDTGNYICKVINSCGDVQSVPISVKLEIIGSDNENNETSTDYYLYPCTPNPFDDYTNIKFQLPQVGIVKLTISDISGRELLVLADKQFDAGTNEIKFKAGDYNLTNGTYFYSISVNGFKDTKKMILMK
ncbi:MAG: T9SS type A sorting domain-containing protein [Candidatus Kapabacteria bacterium]|nr:T9SS type A sorting domain-containing protein [Candidatus Kapabacteria bacterium]